MVQQPPLPSHATCVLFVGAARRPSFVIERCRVRIRELGPSEILLRVRLAGLCASDLQQLTSEESDGAMVLGHEAVGDVIASRRPGFDAGARLVFSSSNWCMVCDSCRRGTHVACGNVTKYGRRFSVSPSSPECVLGGGALSAYVLLRSGTAVCRVPTSVPDGHALLATCPLATAVAGILRLARCSPLVRLGWKDGRGTASTEEEGGRPLGRPTALVKGCDLVGTLACAVLAESGFEVFCQDPNISRMRLASKFQAKPLFKEPGPLTPVASLPDKLDVMVIAFGDSFDYDRRLERCCGRQTPLAAPLLQGPEGLQLRAGGTLLLLRQPSSASPTDFPALEVGAILEKGLCVIGIAEYEPDNLKDAVQFLEVTEGKFPYDELLSPIYDIMDFQSALASALDSRFLRVLVRPCHD